MDSSWPGSSRLVPAMTIIEAPPDHVETPCLHYRDRRDRPGDDVRGASISSGHALSSTLNGGGIRRSCNGLEVCSRANPLHNKEDALFWRKRGSVKYLTMACLGLAPQIAGPVHHVVIHEIRLFPFDRETPRPGFIVAVDKDGQTSKTAGSPSAPPSGARPRDGSQRNLPLREPNAKTPSS
jgi:hypothetical protein